MSLTPKEQELHDLMLISENTKLAKERDEARAACAEMRSIIERHCYSDNGEKLAIMIPANVGKGWHSPQEWSQLEAQCAEIRKALIWMYNHPDLAYENFEALLLNDCGKYLLERMERKESALRLALEWMALHPTVGPTPIQAIQQALK